MGGEVSFTQEETSGFYDETEYVDSEETERLVVDVSTVKGGPVGEAAGLLGRRGTGRALVRKAMLETLSSSAEVARSLIVPEGVDRSTFAGNRLRE